MDKEYYYYQCDRHSKAGRELYKFHRSAQHADEAAEAYAKRYEASSYVQPAQFFTGGIDYLEFDKEPDPQVWRKKFTAADGRGEYEPNCMVGADICALFDEHLRPSDTWNTTYSKERLTWEQVKNRKTAWDWLQLIHEPFSGSTEEAAQRAEDLLKNRVFVEYLYYYGDQPHEKHTVAPRTLRQAVHAEKDRVTLPVVRTEDLYTLLGMLLPQDAEEAKTYLQETETPTYFIYDDTWYVRTCHPCSAEGLHGISEGTYTVKMNMAQQQEKRK